MDRTTTLQKQLSFIDASLLETIDVTKSSGNWSPQAGFWQRVLRERPAAAFTLVRNRTLSFWVQFYTKWKALALAHEAFLTKQQLCAILGSRGIAVVKLCALFEQGIGGKIDAREMMVAGVLLSYNITTEHKFRFFFGLFDPEDKGSLTLEQFSCFLSTYRRGLCAAFDVPEKDRPDDHAIATWATELFTRVSKAAATRIKGMLVRQADAAFAVAVMRMAKDRTANGCTQEVPKLEYQRPQAHEQSVTYAALERYLIGQSAADEPLSLLVWMSFQRWGAARHGVFSDEYDGDFGDKPFRLNGEVKPREDCIKSKSDCLIRTTRAEVILSCVVFQKLAVLCGERQARKPAGSQVTDICKECACKFTVDSRFVPRLTRALQETLDEVGFRDFANADSLLLLRRLYVGASSKTLRMFEVWSLEYDNLVNGQESLEFTMHEISRNDSLQVLGVDELLRLKREFARLDCSGLGRIETSVLMESYALEVGEDSFSELFCMCEDGFVDEHDFLRIMCPLGFRLPEMAGSIREVVRTLLASEASEAKTTLDALETSVPHISLTRPEPLKPLVDTESWQEWLAAFESVDVCKDGVIFAKELIVSGKFSRDVALALVSLIDSENQTSFTRKAFLEALLHASGFRLADPDGHPVK